MRYEYVTDQTWICNRWDTIEVCNRWDTIKVCNRWDMNM